MADLYMARCRACDHRFEFIVGPLMMGPRETCQRCGNDPQEESPTPRCPCGGNWVLDDGEIHISHRCPKCDAPELDTMSVGCVD